MVAIVTPCALAMSIGLGTVFGPTAGDPSNPRDELACPQRTATGRRMRALLDGDVLVAHPHLPCGTVVVVCVVRTGACVVAPVADRGPRRAMVDLSTGAARLLGWGRPGGFSGREAVTLAGVVR
jgi:hypothetical protein